VLLEWIKISVKDSLLFYPLLEAQGHPIRGYELHQILAVVLAFNLLFYQLDVCYVV
jgi:hypothetical protein